MYVGGFSIKNKKMVDLCTIQDIYYKNKIRLKLFEVVFL